MSYYENKAQPLTKEDFNVAIKAIKSAKKIKYEHSPILYVIPVSWVKKLNIDLKRLSGKKNPIFNEIADGMKLK